MNNNLAIFSELIRKLNQEGHSPATSGNYSHFDRENEIIYISESGIDKEFYSNDNWVEHGSNGKKTSAETDLHLEIYKNTNASYVIHSHKLCFNTSLVEINFSNQEILKAISGIETHETSLNLPVFPNTQDIKSLSLKIFNEPEVKTAHAFLISNHGLTVWGKDLAETKRHLETYEYLFNLLKL